MAARSPDRRRRQTGTARLQDLAAPQGQSRVDCRLQAATLDLRADLWSAGTAAARSGWFLYWTSEPRKEDALMSLPYHSERVEEAGRHFDETVRRFEVTTPPEAAICGRSAGARGSS